MVVLRKFKVIALPGTGLNGLQCGSVSTIPTRLPGHIRSDRESKAIVTIGHEAMAMATAMALVLVVSMLMLMAMMDVWSDGCMDG